ncbi:MAG: 50S ribosomal protein L9, partial [Candidatus Omnitrophota bacterium]
MKVILIENVDKLGSIGDVITVKTGYARNFLIPKKLAKEATAGNLKSLESLLKKKAI